jgi:hypothetical protein
MIQLESITTLLSSHRHPHNAALPASLTRQQLASLLRSNQNPNESQEKFPTELQALLGELQARGEVLAGAGNRYCIAPPAVLVQDRENFTGGLFQGDRAYLRLVHQVLRTEQSFKEIRIHPRVRGFHRVRDHLQQIGVRLLTAADSIQQLPYPRKPNKAVLRVPLTDSPFNFSSNYQTTIQRYVPKRDTSQQERWILFAEGLAGYRQLIDETLLRLPTGEYLWFVEGNFYELDPDTALLTMFHLDFELKHRLKLAWDESQGKLNLQGVFLPNSYAQWLWRLSEPDGERYRIRYVSPTNRPLIKSAFNRLGCLLV